MRNTPTIIKLLIIFAFIIFLVVIAALYDNSRAQSRKNIPARTWLGIQVLPINKIVAQNLNLVYKRGLLVQNVIPGSPADAAGIIEGDIIRRVGSLQLLNTEQLRLYIKEKLPGQKIRIVFLRNELTLTTYATLEISQINNPDTKLVYGTFP